MAERRHSFHGPIFAKILVFLGTSGNKMRMEIPNKFLNLCQVIIVFTPTLCFPRLKQQISSEHLIHHAGKRPDIRGLVISLSKDNLRWPVLSSLNLSRKMVMFPTCISQICNLNLKRFFQLTSSVKFDLAFLYVKEILHIFRLIFETILSVIGLCFIGLWIHIIFLFFLLFYLLFYIFLLILC